MMHGLANAAGTPELSLLKNYLDNITMRPMMNLKSAISATLGMFGRDYYILSNIVNLCLNKSE